MAIGNQPCSILTSAQKDLYSSDEEFADFCTFYEYLQKKRRGNDFNTKRHLCIASNNVGDPDSKRSPGQASFFRDLRIIAEAAGIGKCQLILSEDHRFDHCTAGCENKV